MTNPLPRRPSPFATLRPTFPRSSSSRFALLLSGLLFALVLAAATPTLAHAPMSHSAPMVVETPSVRVAKRRKRVKRRKAAKPVPRNDAPAAGDPAAAAPAATPAPARQSDPLPGAGVRRGPNRIDFDERLIKGQTNKANAIYLFERRSSGMRTLVQKRAHFHREIDDTLR